MKAGNGININFNRTCQTANRHSQNTQPNENITDLAIREILIELDLCDIYLTYPVNNSNSVVGWQSIE